MSRRWFVILFAALLTVSCARKQAQAPAPKPAPSNAFALFADDGGHVGRIVVSNQGGSVELEESNTVTRVAAVDVAPSAPATSNEAELRRLFGSALDALPDPQAEFIFYFQTGGDVLTAESEALIPALIQAVRDRQSTDISITGHTDTTDDGQANYTLGLRRAQRVAEILRDRGFDSAYLTIESHGEADLLVRTADGVDEARNRRVEVIVR